MGNAPSFPAKSIIQICQIFDITNFQITTNTLTQNPQVDKLDNNSFNFASRDVVLGWFRWLKYRRRHLVKYWGRQGYCFNKMMSHFPIVLEQKTIVLQSIWGDCPPLIKIENNPSLCLICRSQLKQLMNVQLAFTLKRQTKS